MLKRFFKTSTVAPCALVHHIGHLEAGKINSLNDHDHPSAFRLAGEEISFGRQMPPSTSMMPAFMDLGLSTSVIFIRSAQLCS
jgi:hypothetical protein